MDEIFFQQIVNGIMLGSVYGLIAVGFTLLFGVLGVVNLAHGEVAMIGAFLCLVVVRLGLPFLAAVVVVVVATAVLSVVIERVSFKPFRKSSFLTPMLSTIGISIFLQSIGTQLWGSDPTTYKVGVEVVTFKVGPVLISTIQVLIVVVALALMLGLSYLIERTKIGRGMRAIAENPEMARAIGINAGPVIVATFAVSGPIAGIAGIMVGLNITAITAFMGLEMGLKALVAVVIGGMGNVYGAMIAGLILGITETFVTGYFSTSYRDIVVYVMLLMVLLVRPAGLLGRLESRRV
ncbi:MAG: branched-chain amino acid ABC transporter permease [Chloroflexi bacterium]|nr:branched-chain amino acid ABC transporter permease [Chloroflexota bacterium]